MPAVRAFAFYAGVALLIDFLLQITLFVSLVSLDLRRSEKGKIDVFCCLNGERKEDRKIKRQSLLYRTFKDVYAPFLFNFRTRLIVPMVFFGWFCVSVALIPKIEVGLEQELSMPEDSYVLEYFR